MNKLLLTCGMILIWASGLLIVDVKAQVAYGISIVRINESTRIVDGYSGTWLDYAAGLYYDPAVQGDLYRTDQPETSLAYGYNEGFADIIPAEVYLATTNFVEGKTYCTYSQHFVRAYFYYTVLSQWFDPFRYSSFVYTGGNSFPGYPFSYYYYFTRRYRLGATQACITIPNAPTPTPTPVPTPTPSPTPCNPALGENCQIRTTLSISPDVILPRGHPGRNQTANVKVCTTPAIAGQSVSLELSIGTEYRNSGGHIAANHRGSRPPGKLGRSIGQTGSSGCFSTLYYPSHIGSVITVNARILGNTLSRNVIVGAFNTDAVDENRNFKLVGETTSHPSNHWGREGAILGLEQIALDYNYTYYGGETPPDDELLAYNDMTLSMGGKFDLGRDWMNSGAHAEHLLGINCDVRSNNVPRSRWARLTKIFENRHSTRTLDETGTNSPHWHLRFENELGPNGETSQIRDGIEQNPSAFIEVGRAEITPHTFVEDAWEALGRVATQEEWEVWHDRLVQAKAQGPTALLEEVKAMERSIFSLSEYVARHRTDEEFVTDMFWSHLLRQPTQLEVAYWMDYLRNLPPILTPQRKRARTIAEFEDLRDFEDLVNSIVDSNEPVQPAG